MPLRGWIARRSKRSRFRREAEAEQRLPSEPKRKRAGYKNLTKAEEQLWHEIGDLFEDDKTFHASADVGFHDLTPDDVQRLWEHLRARTASIELEAHVEPLDDEHIQLTIPSAEGYALRLRTSDVRVCLSGTCSTDQRLPNVQLELGLDGITIYWWVGLDYYPWWTPKTVGAFATLLGELRELVPHARLEYEWSDDHDDFWGPVERFHAAERPIPTRYRR